MLQTPGPGAYSVTNPDTLQSKMPVYSMIARNMMPGDNSQKPGPGAHSPERVSTGAPARAHAHTGAPAPARAHAHTGAPARAHARTHTHTHTGARTRALTRAHGHERTSDTRAHGHARTHGRTSTSAHRHMHARTRDTRTPTHSHTGRHNYFMVHATHVAVVPHKCVCAYVYAHCLLPTCIDYVTLQVYVNKRKMPAFSFGIKHTQYEAPLIVEPPC